MSKVSLGTSVYTSPRNDSNKDNGRLDDDTRRNFRLDDDDDEIIKAKKTRENVNHKDNNETSAANSFSSGRVLFFN
jgi:hypothetical protein